MRRTICLITSTAALALAPAAVAYDKPPNPLDLICGPTANCQVEPLPEIPPVR